MSEKVYINCGQGGPVQVTVKDGKIIRVRPLVFNDNDPLPGKLKPGKTSSHHSVKYVSRLILLPKELTDLFGRQDSISDDKSGF